MLANQMLRSRFMFCDLARGEYVVFHGPGYLITTRLDDVAAGVGEPCASGSQIDPRRCIADEHCLLWCPWAPVSHVHRQFVRHC